MRISSTIQKLAIFAQISSGLITLSAAFFLWQNVSAPAAERSQETFQTLDALQDTLAKLQPQVERIPEISKQTSSALTELAESIIIIGTEVDKLLDVSESSLDSTSQSLSALKDVSEIVHGVADNTTWVPNSDFHDFRAQLYVFAKDIKKQHSDLDALLKTSKGAVQSIRPQLRNTLNSTAQLLSRYAHDLNAMEASVLPSLPPLLNATSSSVRGLAIGISQTSSGINLLCLALAGIGISFSSAGVIRIHTLQSSKL